jgi:hypothetical protein
MGRRPEFVIPKRKRAGKDTFDANPRKVAHWLSELPRANAGETARRIFQALTNTNQYHIKCRNRVNLLESLREPTQFVCEHMQKRFVGETFPLPEKNRQIAVASRQLADSMATGYKIAIDDLLNDSLFFTDRRTLGLLLHRAITYLTRVLLISYQAYTEFPAEVWADLHKLFAFAEQRKLHRIPIADEQHQYINKTTVETEYTRALLLFLSSPYHLRHGEAANVHVNLERWMSHVKLVPYTGEETGGFVINLETDDPPRFVSLVDAEWANMDCRVLNTDSLIDELEKEKERSTENVSSTLITMGRQDAALPHDLLKKLITAWRAADKRRFARAEKNEVVRAATGMTSIHCGLLKQTIDSSVAGKVYDFHRESLRDMFNRSAEYDSRDITDVNTPKADVWDMVYSNRTSDVQVKSEAADAEHDAKVDQSCAIDSWNVINESAGGLLMRCAGDLSAHVQVGELIAVERMAGEHWTWSLGLVRWMKTHGDEGMEIGVLMLAPDAIPVGVTLAVDATTKRQFQRALLVPGSVASRHQTTLITPPYPYRAGAVVSVFFMGNETRLQLTKQLGNSGLCAQFHFKVLQSAAARDKKPVEDEFNDVWKLI